MLGLEHIIAGIMLVSLTFYAILGGADFGGGVWDLFVRGPRAEAQRDLIADTIGPIWEANHVWLILVIVILFTAFPPAFSLIMTVLHIPLTLMLIGIVLRGTAFTFRKYDSQADDVQRRWSRIFAISSIFTPIMLGICIGALSSNQITLTPEGVLADFVTPWLAPFPFAVGGFALALFVFLAAVYLTVEARIADGDDTDLLQEDFRRRALIAAAAVGVMALLVLLLSGNIAPHIQEDLVGQWWSWPLLITTGGVALGAIWALWTRRFYTARALAVAQVVLIMWGWGFAQFPYLVGEVLTIQQTAAPDVTLRLLLIALSIGALILFPSFYLLYRVFGGRRIFALTEEDEE